MMDKRGPRHSGKCPFYIVQGDPISAERSISRCVNCATEYNKRLQTLKKDFRQIALLTILKETPKYDPDHPSGASYTTFIKKQVCVQLWQARKKELKYLSFQEHEQPAEVVEDCPKNPLIAGLIAEACTHESVEDEVNRKLEVERFCEHLPNILAKLTEKERTVLELKFFQEQSGVEIAKTLGISNGRVSQILKSALAKMEKAYRLALETD